MSEDKKYNCSICGEEISSGLKLKSEYVCNNCVISYSKYLEKENIKKSSKENNLKTPVEIAEFIKGKILAQDEAIDVLSASLYNHILRTRHNERCIKEKKPDLLIEKSNIMLVGPTGVGKTASIKELSRVFNIPYAIADASTLTAAGYAGKDVESILMQLVNNANGNIEQAERGFIFLDEFDKLSRKSSTISSHRDVGGEAVQQSLLKMVEGGEFTIEDGNIISSSSTTIDTSNILFILGGAFEGIEDISNNKTTNSNIGFLRNNNDVIINEDKGGKITTEDLIEYGIIPEIIGRAPIICEFNELKKEDLRSILTESRNSIIDQAKRMCQLSNVDLEFTDEALSEIVDKAYARKVGARGLKGILEERLTPIYMMLPNKSISKIIVTRDYIKGEGNPKVLKRKKKEVVHESKN